MEQLVKFILVGIVNTLITILSYFVFVQFGMHYILANGLSYLAGLVNSYYWNKQWVFQDSQNHLHVFGKFSLVNLLVLLFNTTCLYLCVHHFGVNRYIAQIFAMAAGTSINFIVNKLWTFDSKFRISRNEF